MRISEGLVIRPLLMEFSTAAATSLFGKTQVDGMGDFSVLCQVRCASVSTGHTASAAMNWDFVVTEATAATANGSAITGATLTLGAATVCEVKGAVNAILKVTSNISSAVQVTINGIVYRTTAAGATASNGAKKLASAINGNATSPGLLHYKAVAEVNNTGIVHITPSDDMGTGLTYVTTAAAATMVPYMTHLQGCIDIAQSKLSTNYPKFIGVNCTPLTGSATSIMAANLISWPSAAPSMPGKHVNLST